MAPKFTSMAVSTCDEYFLIGAHGAATRSAPLVHKFTFQTAKQHRPYYLSRPRVGPSSFSSFSPRQSEGDGAPSGATIVIVCPRSLSRPRGAARRATQTSLRSLGLFAGVFLTAPGRAFRGRPKQGGLRQPSSWRAARIGRQAEPRRRPGACLRGTPAGAASCSTIRRL